MARVPSMTFLFSPSVDPVVNSAPPFFLSQCLFIQMIDTDFTLLPIYANTDLARLHAMIFTSPPSLSHFRL
jgi:uncharacterized membrane protein